MSMADHPSPAGQPNVCSTDAMARCLLAGGAGLMPTDTLPALIALPDHARQIWTLKQRPSEKPLILMAANAEALLALVRPEAEAAARPLAQLHWPGALTMVLPIAGDALAQSWLRALNPGATTLGLRVPACAQARQLLARTGPLATTSANPSGDAAALTAAQAHRYFPDLPLLGPTPWPAPQGLASTVLAWHDEGSWQTLRAGAVMPAGVDPSPPCSG